MGLIKVILIVFLFKESMQKALKRTVCKSHRENVPRLNCIFPENLQEITSGFCVARNMNGKVETVLECNMVHGDAICHSLFDFEVLEPSNATFELNVKVPQDSLGARFYCSTLPRDKDTVLEECEGPSNENSPDLSRVEISTHANGKTKPESEDEEKFKFGVIVLSLSTFLFMVSTVFVSILFYRQRVKQISQPTKTGNREAVYRESLLIVKSENNDNVLQDNNIMLKYNLCEHRLSSPTADDKHEKGNFSSGCSEIIANGA